MEFYDLELKLKSYLSKYKIRLCDSPYTIDNEKGDEFKALAEKLSKDFNHEISEIEKSLDILRIKSIKNIKSSGVFNESNVCSIKIHQPKFVDDITLEITDFDQASGLFLREEISKLLFVSPDLIKIISKGKLIADDDLLIRQGIKNNCRVMVLFINEENVANQEISATFGKNRDMAEYLSKRAVDGKFETDMMEIEITNQSGEVLSLTKEQKSLLAFGLTMHQQAVTFITNGQYQIALLHCLEADEAFTRSQYSESIDNVAILQLDIVWCYYCLQNMDDISDAKNRLNTCEIRMKKCYGEGNERIRKIREKKSFEGVPESVHVFRLYLLKAIVSYYENNIGNGRENMLKALEVYKSFEISEPLVTEVMLLGFSRGQAIEGLRAHKDINSCVEYILRRKQDKSTLELKKKEDLKRNAIARRLGYTEDNSRIDLEVVERLIAQSHMNSKLCLAAVRRANNNFLNAMDLLFAQEEQLINDINLQQHRGIVVDGDVTYEALLREKQAITEIQHIVNKDRQVIKRFLRQCDGNVEMASNILMDKNFHVPTIPAPNNSSSSSSLSGSPRESSEDRLRNIEMENNIYKSVGEGSGQSLENQYINPDLTNEIIAFNKFAKVLNISPIDYVTENIAW